MSGILQCLVSFVGSIILTILVFCGCELWKHFTKRNSDSGWKILDVISFCVVIPFACVFIFGTENVAVQNILFGMSLFWPVLIIWIAFLFYILELSEIFDEKEASFPLILILTCIFTFVSLYFMFFRAN